MMRKFLLASWLWLAAAVPALANVPCSLPFNLQNGTTADASQVMANYNALVTCLGSAAIAGVNNDITQLIGITTPLSPVQGGSNVFIGGTSTGSANAQVVSSTTPSGFALTAGYQVVFKAGFTNSGSTTLTVGSTATTNLFKQSNTGPTALTGNEIQAGQIVFAWYDGTQWEMLPPLNVTANFGIAISGGAAVGIDTVTAPPFGYGLPINMGLSATVGSNLLTVCITTAGGATPSATSPVLLPYRNNTISGGTVTWLSVTSSLCMNTNATGASLGAANSTPFRFWIGVFNNSGTPVIGLYNASCSNCNGTGAAGSGGPQIFPLDDAQIASTTGIGAASNKAGLWYTPNGINLTNKSFVIAGYVEYSAGLATAGTYGIAPTGLRVFGPGVHKPGEPVQVIACCTAGLSPGGQTSNTFTPTSAINLVEISASGRGSAAGASTTLVTFSLRQGNASGTILVQQPTNCATDGGNIVCGFSFTRWIDAPSTSSSQQYTITANVVTVSAQINLWEIQG